MADPTSYDAIVIGSGISGGWAAKELCEKGLKTLVLERGRGVQHVKDYPTMNTRPWELPHRGMPHDRRRAGGQRDGKGTHKCALGRDDRGGAARVGRHPVSCGA